MSVCRIDPKTGQCIDPADIPFKELFFIGMLLLAVGVAIYGVFTWLKSPGRVGDRYELHNYHAGVLSVPSVVVLALSRFRRLADVSPTGS